MYEFRTLKSFQITVEDPDGALRVSLKKPGELILVRPEHKQIANEWLSSGFAEPVSVPEVAEYELLRPFNAKDDEGYIRTFSKNTIIKLKKEDAILLMLQKVAKPLPGSGIYEPWFNEREKQEKIEPAIYYPKVKILDE